MVHKIPVFNLSQPLVATGHFVVSPIEETFGLICFANFGVKDGGRWGALVA